MYVFFTPFSGVAFIFTLRISEPKFTLYSVLFLSNLKEETSGSIVIDDKLFSLDLLSSVDGLLGLDVLDPAELSLDFIETETLLDPGL